MKKAIVAALFLLVCIMGVLCLRRAGPADPATLGDCENCPSAAVAGEPAGGSDSLHRPSGGPVIVYYFFTTQRCASCLKIENYTKEVVERQFASQLSSGQVIWKMVNTDLEENEHYIKDYSLITKSVVLVEQDSNRVAHWKNLDKVWMLLGQKDKYQAYIAAEIRGFVGA